MSILKNNYVVGIISGLVAVVIAPVIIPAVKKTGRPLAKSLIKGGIVLYEKGREAVAGTGEMMEDVMAEVRAEMIEKHFSQPDATESEMPPRRASQPHGGNGSNQFRSGSNEQSPPAEAGAAQ